MSHILEQVLKNSLHQEFPVHEMLVDRAPNAGQFLLVIL